MASIGSGNSIGKLSEERVEKAKKMHDAMAERAQNRIDSEQVTKAVMAKKAKKPAAVKTPATPKKPVAKNAAPKHGKNT